MHGHLASIFSLCRVVTVDNRRDFDANSGASIESARAVVQEDSFIHPLIAHMRMGTTCIVVLTGPDGCGKTTAVLRLADHAKSKMNTHVYRITRHTFHSALESTESKRLLILDDFLGHTFLDCFSEWRDVIDTLKACAGERPDGLHIVLVTRKSVLEQAWKTFGIDLAVFVRKSNTVELDIDREQILDTFQIRARNSLFNLTPSIGFPLCCALRPHVVPELRLELFLSPRSTLVETFRRHIGKCSVAPAALALLSTEEKYVNMEELREEGNLNPFFPDESDSLTSEADGFRRVRQILRYYKQNEGLLRIEDEFVSFANEAVKEAALFALLEKYTVKMKPHLSMRLISQLAVFASDRTEEADHKPVLTNDIINVFLSIMQNEVEHGNFREVFTSPLLLHPSVADKFDEMFTDEFLEKMPLLDANQIPIAFWAGAFPKMFERKVFPYLSCKSDECSEYLTVLTCCFWGHPDLLKRFLKKAKHLQTAKVEASFHLGQLPIFNTSILQYFNQKDNFFTTAAGRGHMAVVDVLLEEWRTLSFAKGEGLRNTLMHVAFRGESEKVQACLTKKEDADGIDRFGMTALHYAFSRDEWELPEEMIKFAGGKKEAALVVACENGWGLPEIQRMYSADFTFTDHEVARRCLTAAVIMDNLDVFQWLKNAFGDLELNLLKTWQTSVLTRNGRKVFEFLNGKKETNHFQQAVFTKACRLSDVPRVTAILEHCPVELRVEGLMNACSYGNAAVVEALLSKLNDIEKKYRRCLEISLDSLSLQCLELLLVPRCSMKSKEYLLQKALISGNLHVLKRLCEWEPNLLRSFNWSHLHSAIESDSPRVLDWWYNTFGTNQQPVNVDERLDSGETPMAIACRLGHRRAASWLADHGANLFVTDNQGRYMCLVEAEENHHDDLVGALQSIIGREATSTEVSTA